VSRLERLLLVVSTLSALTIFGLAPEDEAKADHIYDTYLNQPNWYIKWPNPFVRWCLEDALTGLPNGAANEYQQATATLSNPSDWFLAPSQCVSSQIWMGSRSFSTYGWSPAPGLCWCWSNGRDMTSAFVYLNTDLNWTLTRTEGASMGSELNLCNPSCYAETVVLHEVGHSARFKHPNPPFPTTIMCLDYKVRRILNLHDRNSLQTLY
jgi:hypothetical protein